MVPARSSTTEDVEKFNNRRFSEVQQQKMLRSSTTEDFQKFNNRRC
jgi:hypothetical protein